MPVRVSEYVPAGVPPELTGCTVSIAVFITPPYDPLMVTGVEAATDPVLTVNIPLACPAATVTLAGTVAAALVLERDTDAPPFGAN